MIDLQLTHPPGREIGPGRYAALLCFSRSLWFYFSRRVKKPRSDWAGMAAFSRLVLATNFEMNAKRG
jgi:hypothetical protein